MESASLFAHIAQIRHSLARVRGLQVGAPATTSPLRLAIDPDVKRRLKFTSPLEAISLPEMPETWDFFDELLVGLGDACDISDKRSPLNWEVSWIYSSEVTSLMCIFRASYCWPRDRNPPQDTVHSYEHQQA